MFDRSSAATTAAAAMNAAHNDRNMLRAINAIRNCFWSSNGQLGSSQIVVQREKNSGREVEHNRRSLREHISMKLWPIGRMTQFSLLVRLQKFPSSALQVCHGAKSFGFVMFIFSTNSEE